MEGHGVDSKGARIAVSALVAALSLAGCAKVPSGAPTASEFRQPETSATSDSSIEGPYFIEINGRVLDLLGRRRASGLAASFGSKGYRPTLKLSPGDTISITLFDFSSLPLFGGTAGTGSSSSVQPYGHTATIPTQTIEGDGTVAIPFGGSVKVAGLTPEQAGQQIERALKGAASDVHAVVTVLTSNASVATAGGELGRPGILPLTLRGERVLDLVSEAGGAKFPAQDCDVELIRHGRVAKINLQQIVEHPEENVLLQPGDTVFVSHNARSFAVLGAALKVSQYDFDKPKVTLAEALARAGGPSNATANISDVYLLRSESTATITEIFSADRVKSFNLHVDDGGRTYPVAYHIDLRHADGYFQSQALPLSDKDLIIVANADSVQLQEALQIVRNITGIAYDLSPLLRNLGTTTSSETIQ